MSKLFCTLAGRGFFGLEKWVFVEERPSVVVRGKSGLVKKCQKSMPGFESGFETPKTPENG